MTAQSRHIPEETGRLMTEAIPWIDNALAGHGLRRVGEPAEPRVRSWATVTSIRTTGGTVWFKAASDATAHEIRLYPLLAELALGTVLHPFAADAERAWLLLPDGGSSLRQVTHPDALMERLVEFLPRYALLQRATSSHVSAMLDMGVPDMRPEQLPQRFGEAIAASEAIIASHGTTMDKQVLHRIRAVEPRFHEWCDRLLASPIQPAIDHSDLHDNNILLNNAGDHIARVYHWGDSVVAHPFSSLLVFLRATMDRLEATPDDVRLEHLRDAYLEPFTDLEDRARLADLVNDACWTSVVIRAICWAKVLRLGAPPDPDWVTAPFSWMQVLLGASWLE